MHAPTTTGAVSETPASTCAASCRSCRAACAHSGRFPSTPGSHSTKWSTRYSAVPWLLASVRSPRACSGRTEVDAKLPARLGAGRPGAQLAGVQHGPDVLDPAVGDVERQHGDGDAIELSDQAGPAADGALQDGHAGGGARP